MESTWTTWWLCWVLINHTQLLLLPLRDSKVQGSEQEDHLIDCRRTFRHIALEVCYARVIWMLHSPGKADVEEKQLVLCWEGGQNDQGRHRTTSQWHVEGN